jgi:DNA primase
MHQAGIINTVALMGPAVSAPQIVALKRLAATVVLMLSGEDAGVQAILRAGALAWAADLEVLVASLPADATLPLSCNATAPPRQ